MSQNHQKIGNERKKGALKAGEENYRLLVENQSDLMIKVDTEGRFLFVSPSYCRMFGKTEAELIGSTFMPLVHEEDREAAAKTMRGLHQPPYTAYVEQRTLTRNGWRWLAWVGTAILNDEAEVTAIIGVGRDISLQKAAEGQLREQEQQYRNIFNTVNDGLIVSDPEGVILQANPAACRIYGYDADEMVGMNAATLVHPDSHHQLQRFIEKTRQGLQFHGKTVDIRKDGTRIDVSVSGSRIDLRGRDCRLAIIRDVSASQKNTAAYTEKVALLALSADIGKALTRTGIIEATLQACTEHLVAHLDAAFARIWIMNGKGVTLVLAASAGIVTRLDGAHARIAVESYPFKIGVIARERRAIVTNHVRTDAQIEDHEWATRKGLTAFAGYPMVVDDAVVGVIGIFFKHPITASTVDALSAVADEIALGVFRSRAQTALGESEEKYRLIFDNASDAIFIAQDDDIKFPNKATLQAIGYSADELAHLKLTELIHPEDREDVVRRHLMRMNGKVPGQPKPYRVIRKDGQIVWVEPKAVTIQWEGRPASLNFLRDITRRVVMKERMERSQRLEAIGTLAGGIAHDFNNILSAIIGYTEIAIMDAQERSPLKKHLSKVLQAGDRARHLVEQILTFSRQGGTEPKPVQIRLIVMEALKLLRATLPATIDIHRQLKSNATVMADPTQIHQVVINLCTNAAQAMQQGGGKLTLTLEAVDLGFDFVSQHPDVSHGRYLRLSVEDTGPGIPEGIIGRVFDPFFTTKATGEGTGLGLSVVHGIVASHGGMVTVASKEGAGTVFHVYLPVIDADEPRPLSQENPLPLGTERVLLVDDEQFQVDIGRQLLGRLGYTVTTFTDSREALQHFLSTPEAHDIVITDMTMPRMTGDQLALSILAARPETPIILCTGYSDRIDAEKAAAMGIKGFALKPIIFKDIARLIRSVLDKS